MPDIQCSNLSLIRLSAEQREVIYWSSVNQSGILGSLIPNQNHQSDIIHLGPSAREVIHTRKQAVLDHTGRKPHLGLNDFQHTLFTEKLAAWILCVEHTVCIQEQHITG